MVNSRMFLRCNICGNIIGMIHDSGVTPVCCGEEMELLMANTVDAAKEKHVPATKRNGNEIKVTIGEVEHPMTEAHHIEWIAIAGKDQTQRVALSHTGAPRVTFCVEEKEPITVYAYCNLHGLWVSEA